MQFSPFTVPQDPAKWVSPLSPDLVYKNTMYKEGIAKENLDELSQISSQLASIPAYGKDAEILQQKLQELKANMSKLNLANVGDYNTMSQIKGLIGNFKNDPNITNIAKRGHKFNQWESEIKDYQEKGKFVPAWKLKGYDDAKNYYTGNEYIADKQFIGNITPGFDWDKHNKTLVEETPEYHQLKKSGVNNDLYQGKTYEALQGKFYEGLNQPGAYDDLKDQFEHFYGNEDYATQDQQTALQQVNRLQGIIQNSNNPILIEKAKRDLDYWDDFASTVNPNTSKQEAFDRFIRANAEDFARTNTNYALKESKMSDSAKLYSDFDYDRKLADYKAKQEAGLIPGVPGKDEGEANIVLQDLENFKQEDTHNRVPAAFQTKSFEKTITKEKPTEKYTYVDGKPVLEETSVTTEKTKEYPTNVGYNKNSGEYIIKYSDGSITKLSDVGVREKLYISDPKKYGSLMNTQTTDSLPIVTTQEEYNNLPIGTEYKDSRGVKAIKK